MKQVFAVGFPHNSIFHKVFEAYAAIGDFVLILNSCIYLFLYLIIQELHPPLILLPCPLFPLLFRHVIPAEHSHLVSPCETTHSPVSADNQARYIKEDNA
jgi:hypothetical protein